MLKQNWYQQKLLNILQKCVKNKKYLQQINMDLISIVYILNKNKFDVSFKDIDDYFTDYEKKMIIKISNAKLILQ